jgi:hypothetical protein
MLFEALHEARLDLLTEVSYLVGLRFSERDRFPSWRKWLPIRPGDSTDEAVALAARLIEDIERAEGKPLARLTERELGPYHRCIHNIVDRRREQEDPPDPEVVERAKQALEEMRRMYGGPGGTPLAEAVSTL